MWIVMLVVSATLLLVLAAAQNFLPAWHRAEWGWRWLSLSGIPLGLTGVNFIVRFWHPTAGPYRANELYPYGSHLQTWAVSFGFAWIAFGLLFMALALLVTRETRKIIWLTLLVSWFVCWLPHGIIGIGFAWAGQNAPSIESYQQWAARSAGFALLLFNAVTLLAHFALSLAGFLVTGWSLWRNRRSAEIR